MDIEGDIVAADGHCSLREAITTANDDVPPFAGAGECAAGSINDVVTVPAGEFVLSRTGPPDNNNVNGAPGALAPKRLSFRVVRP